MESIFHEKQEGSLCAQHCLNALLQGHYFTPVDLAEIAQQLDDQERQQMAEGGLQSEGYRQFMEQPSSNYDDSGFFSIQVIDTALRVWGLELLPFNSQNEIAQTAQRDPVQMKSYICNFREHWLTIRKLGTQWFNLNSLLTGPELLSNTYLSLFLTQLQQEGYSIFIVIGDLMECEADQVLQLCPAVQTVKPRLITDSSSTAGKDGADDPELQHALEHSKQLIDSDDKALQKVLQMSMEGYIDETIGRMGTEHREVPSTKAPPTETGAVGYTSSTGSSCSEQSATSLSQEDMRQKRLAFLNKLDKGPSPTEEPNTNRKDSASVQNDSDNKQDSVPSELQLTDSASVNKDSDSRGKRRDEKCDTKLNKTEPEEEENGELSEEEMLKRAIAMSMEAD